MQGQSVYYTPEKQQHIRGVFGISLGTWQRQCHTRKIFIMDCTAGSGRDDSGNDGSPLILNKDAVALLGNKGFVHGLVEADKKSYRELARIPLKNATIFNDDYKNVVPDWLKKAGANHGSMGLIYADANGAKDLILGYEMFQQVLYTYPRIDLMIHFSLTAVDRNRANFNSEKQKNRNSFKWAAEDSLTVMDKFSGLRSNCWIRYPRTHHRWVIMYLIGTSKVQYDWRGIMTHYRKWRREFTGERNAWEDQDVEQRIEALKSIRTPASIELEARRNVISE